MGSEAERFSQRINVSRETLDLLEAYHNLLSKWSRQINLVSKSTLDDIWSRHFLDSAQVFQLLKEPDTSVSDFGSGGGFPGLVLAILAAERRSDLSVTLVESDVRKAAFLMTVVRELELSASVRSDRIEALGSLDTQVITARALAPLEQLCVYSFQHLAPSGRALFLKGARYEQEVDLARAKWDFELTIHPSITNSEAALLELRDLRPKT